MPGYTLAPLKLQRHRPVKQAQWIMQSLGGWEAVAVPISSTGGVQWQLLHPCRDARTNCSQLLGKVVSNQPYTASSSWFPMFLAWQCLIMNAPLPVMDTGCSPHASEQLRSDQIPISARIWLRMGVLPLSGNGHKATSCLSLFSVRSERLGALQGQRKMLQIAHKKQSHFDLEISPPVLSVCIHPMSWSWLHGSTKEIFSRRRARNR